MNQCPSCQRNIGITVKFKSLLLDKGYYCPRCHEELGVHPFWFILLATLSFVGFLPMFDFLQYLIGTDNVLIIMLCTSIPAFLMVIIFLPFVRQKASWDWPVFVFGMSAAFSAPIYAIYKIYFG